MSKRKNYRDYLGMDQVNNLSHLRWLCQRVAEKEISFDTEDEMILDEEDNRLRDSVTCAAMDLFGFDWAGEEKRPWIHESEDNGKLIAELLKTFVDADADFQKKVLKKLEKKYYNENYNMRKLIERITYHIRKGEIEYF